MKRIIATTVVLILIFSCFSFLVVSESKTTDDERFVSYCVNPKKLNVSLFWKNNKGENFKNAKSLKSYLKLQNRELLFAMNGGMYKKDHSPQGLYIENSIMLNEADTANGDGNFYLKPNGIFYITSNYIAAIETTNNFVVSKKVKYATQSGPMLVIDGEIHSGFNKKSTNLNIRNGVGILPNDEILFVMSKKEINFYDLAEYFKSKGCKNALYLDGFVSRTYCPEKNWMQTDGNFGVLIAVTK